MALTAVKIRNMKRPKSGRPVRAHDGNGLFFFRGVRKDVWKLRLRDKTGKEQWLTLGEYPAMSLKEARAAAEEARQDTHAGRKKPTATFREIALRWLEHVGSEWTPKTHQKHLTWLRKDVFPRIGDKRPDEIQAPDVLALLRRVEAAGHLHKVRKLLPIIRRIFSFAISHGEATANPAAALNARDLFKKEQRKNRPAMEAVKDVAMLMRLIWAYEYPIVRGALLMLAWTLSRPGEIREMRWEEIDRERAQWRYVVGKTKTPHAVPLPRQAMALLDEMEPLTGGDERVFPGQRPGQPLSENTLNMALRALGIDTQTQHTAHGFRAMGRTLLREMGYDPEALERQLSHKQPNDTVAAYARETLLAERTVMMQAWADWLDAIREGAEVIPLRRA